MKRGKRIGICNPVPLLAGLLLACEETQPIGGSNSILFCPHFRVNAVSTTKSKARPDQTFGP